MYDGRAHGVVLCVCNFVDMLDLISGMRVASWKKI